MSRLLGRAGGEDADGELYAMYQVSRGLPASLSLEETLSLILDKTQQLIDAKTAALFVIRKHLNLDVARRGDDLLQVERAVPEGRVGLARGGREGVLAVAVERFAVDQKITMMVNRYEIRALGPDDTAGPVIAFAQQKRMAFKEQVTLYTDDTKQYPVLGFKARSVIDLGATYDVTDSAGYR